MTTFTFEYFGVPGFPAGTVAASVVVSLTDAAASPPISLTQTVPNGTPSVVFNDLVPGTYTYSITNVDASGTLLGGPGVSGTLTVAGPAPITLMLVTAATVTP